MQTDPHTKRNTAVNAGPQPVRQAAAAPYNFVEFENRVAVRYPGTDELPHHDVWYPDLLSGRIDLTLTAQTPVFVGGAENGQSVRQFARDKEGRYIIPGSTLRGLLRQNMQILGCGLVRPGQDFQDRRLSYRKIVPGGRRDEQGVWSRELQQEYTRMMDVRRINGRSVPCRVKAGVLYCTSEPDGRLQYEIRPLQRDVYRVNARIKKGKNDKIGQPNPLIEKWKRELPKPITDERLTFAREWRVFYAAEGERVTQLHASPREGLQEGWLVRPGYMRGQNHYYLFPPEKQPDGARLTPDEKRTLGFRYPSREDIFSMQEDWQQRKNQLPGTNGANYNSGFWNLPGKGESKPVFYLEYDGKISIGRSPYLRVTYNNPLRMGLPSRHKQLLKQEEKGARVLDYPSAVMGFISDQASYRSRVQIGDLTACAPVRPLPAASMVLAEPKPSFYAGYVQGGRHYNHEDFALNGYKLYWFKPVQAAAPAGDSNGGRRNQNVGSSFAPLPEGTAFRGSITYHNLTEDELGLLLWCLKLENGCCHAIGKGKPYGYGRMALTDLTLTEWQPDRYTDLTACGRAAGDDRVQQLIDAYKQYLPTLLAATDRTGHKHPGAAPQELASVQQFLYIRKTVRTDLAEVQYMQLNEFDKVPKPLPPLRDLAAAEQPLQKEPPKKPAAAEKPLQEPSQDSWSRLEALAARSKSHRGRR